MKRIIVATLVGLYLPFMAGSEGPKAELAAFLKSGDVSRELAINHDDDGGGLDVKIRAWAQAFGSPKEFAAYFNPDDQDQMTVLGKFVQSNDVLATQILEYLVDECDAQLDVGPAGKTPRDFLEKSPLKGQWSSLFDTNDRFVRIVQGWSQKKYSAKKVIELVDSSIIAIDKVTLPDGQSVNDFLIQLPRNHEMVKVLAHCAPSMEDHYAAFAYLIVGCCECPGEALNMGLLRKFIKDNADLETTKVQQSFKFYAGKNFKDYFTEKALTHRFQEVHVELKKYFAQTAGSNCVHPNTFWVTDPADDADVAKLLVDSARDLHRGNELKHYLNNRQEALYLKNMAYDGHASFEDYFDSLDEGAYPHKNEVKDTINEHLFAHVLSVDPADVNIYVDTIADFVQHVQQHNLDIDSIPYSGTTIGAYAENPLNVEPAIDEIRTRLQPYRSERRERDVFLGTLDAALAHGEAEVAALKAFVADKMLNVDRIITKDGETVADYLAKQPKGPDILALPGINSYRNDASSFKSWLEKALDDESYMANFVNCCDTYKFNVDTLLFEPGKTVGEVITEQLGAGRRKNALKIAELVQNDRSDKDAIVRTLFTSIELGADTDDLKAWCAAFPTLDLGAITYDPVDPKNSDTIGGIIDAKYAALAKELGRTTSQSSSKGTPKGKSAGWSTGQKLGGLALLVGAGIGYCYYMHKASKENPKDQNRVAAV